MVCRDLARVVRLRMGSHTRDDTGISAEAQPNAAFNGKSNHTVVRIE